MWLIKEMVKQDNRKHYRVACSVCGYEKLVRINMINIQTRCKACLTMERNRSTFGKHKGVGDLSKTFFNQFRFTAKRRKIEFSVSIEDLWDLYENQGGKCALTGWDLKFPVGTGIGGALTDAHSPSLDRIDSNKGYVKGNVQWVHKCANIAKNSFTQNEFVALCKAVAAQHANQQPSASNGPFSGRWKGGRKKRVDAKVQRLMGEGAIPISPTRVPGPSQEGDDIVRHSEETRRDTIKSVSLTDGSLHGLRVEPAADCAGQ